MADIKSIAERNRAPQDLANSQSVVKARVVANYGDPGLTEQYLFDILSRFVIVMIEPVKRVPTIENKYRLFALVLRPRMLWVDVDGGVTEDPANQIRSDIGANINVGVVGELSIDNIGQINRPYHLGEEISIRKLNKPIYAHESFFRSEFESDPSEPDDDNYFSPTKSKYNESYLTRDPAGSQSVFGNDDNWDIARTYPMFPILGGIGSQTLNAGTYNELFINGKSVESLVSKFKYSPSYRVKGSSLNAGDAAIDIEDPEFRYAIGLKKYQFETFWRFHHSQDVEDYDKIIDGWSVGNYKNKYMWCNAHSNNYQKSAVVWNNCAWEDVNLDDKARNADNECQPLVVLTPNTFPTPKTRAAGSFKFDPTYTKIIIQTEE